jgi:TPR repeat protein
VDTASQLNAGEKDMGQTITKKCSEYQKKLDDSDGFPIPHDIATEFASTEKPRMEAYERLNRFGFGMGTLGINGEENYGIIKDYFDLELRAKDEYEWGCLHLGKNHSGFFASATNGHTQGRYALARLLEAGVADIQECQSTNSINKDLLAAAYWYQAAAREGHKLAIGKAEYLFKSVLAQAEDGNPNAMFDIGASYETGVFDFVSQDIDSALYWYERAAKAQNVASHRAIGEIYCYGAYGYKQDISTGIRHLIVAAEAVANGASDSREGVDQVRHRRANVDDQRALWLRVCLLQFECASQGDSGVSNLDVHKHLLELSGGERSHWEASLLLAILSYKEKGLLTETQEHLRRTLSDAWLDAIDFESSHGLDLFLDFDDSGMALWGVPFHMFENRIIPNRNQARCRHIEAVLREMAQKEVVEASLLLGLILIGTGEFDSPDLAEGVAWLQVGVRKGEILSCLRFAALALQGRIKAHSSEIMGALRRVVYSRNDGTDSKLWKLGPTATAEQRAYTEKMNAQIEKSNLRYRCHQDGNGIIDTDVFHALQRSAAQQLADCEREEAVQHAKDQAQRDMLSYLTHTLNNTLSSGPEAARQAMRILGSDLYENNREYKAINNIAAMFSTFLFAQQLLKTFKLYIADPELLRQNWEVDVDGDSSITVVLALSLRQTLSQLVFSANHQAALQRLLPHKETGAVKDIRKSFMEEVVPLDVDASNTNSLFDWVHTHLGVIKLHIAEDAELHFRSNSTRFTFFFSSFSELIYNALKYSDGVQPIEVFWEKPKGSFVFRCRNTWSEESLQSSEGSGKGLVFLTRLVGMLGASLSTRSEAGIFEAEIRFPEELILGNA